MGTRVNKGFDPSQLSPRIERLSGLGGQSPAASAQAPDNLRAPLSGGEKPHAPTIGRPVAYFAIFCEARVVAIKKGAGAARAFIAELKLSDRSASSKTFSTELSAQEFASWWNFKADERTAQRHAARPPAPTERLSARPRTKAVPSLTPRDEASYRPAATTTTGGLIIIRARFARPV